MALITSGQCQFDPGGLTAPPHCGDRVISVGEQCDRDNLGGQSCTSLGRGEGTLACTPGCALDVSGCRVGEGCGNGILEPGEQCDDGNRDPCDGCSAICTQERCGNGILECGEECDDGNDANDDACVAGCRLASCGDGYIEAGVERCDVGNVPSTCEAEGYGSGALGCAADCLDFDVTTCTGGDGAPCETGSQCDGGACLAEADLGWPGGVCSRPCALLEPCPASSTCLPMDGGRFCVPRCESTADCRAGYLCALDFFEGSELVCRPRCERDGQCPATGSCNPWQGLCGVPVTPGDGDTGASCGGGEPPCRGACWAGLPGGYCVSLCALSTGFCPPGGLCADVGNSYWGDLGYCLAACEGTGDCPREGYTCLTSPYGSGQVCLPP